MVSSRKLTNSLKGFDANHYCTLVEVPQSIQAVKVHVTHLGNLIAAIIISHPVVNKFSTFRNDQGHIL